jgi:UDP-N-acetylmuramoyl-L-alanyl-D-glutamate--2,6-diaminopimelate ligase
LHLDQLILDVPRVEVVGRRDVDVPMIAFDSRKVRPGAMYVAVRGTLTDGHEYIDAAIASGAKVIVCERTPVSLAPNVTYLLVTSSSEALGFIASNFYSRPSARLTVVGITGTNGKTTTVTLLHAISQMLGFKSGLFSTIRNLIGDEPIAATHTTPDPLQLNSLMRDMVEGGCRRCFMEVSSHAVVQNRIAGLSYAGGIFSNITPEHLDYHGTFEAYFAAKKAFFDMLPAEAFALTNVDDPRGRDIVADARAGVRTYGIQSDAEFRAHLVREDFEGITVRLGDEDIALQLAGKFNAYNALAVYAALSLLGDSPRDVRDLLARIGPVKGRFNRYKSPAGIRGVVDFAHTPDALEQVLASLHAVADGRRIITVVGCGGDRDREKRPQMARIAYELSDLVVLTSDNPRSEKPESIIEEMLTGLKAGRDKLHVIPDRAEAIRLAASLAAEGDILLVAGKGHETYQEVGGVKHPFDDMATLQAALGAGRG